MKRLLVLATATVLVVSTILAACSSNPTATSVPPTVTKAGPTATVLPAPTQMSIQATPTPTSPAATATQIQPTSTGVPLKLKFGAHLALSGASSAWGFAGQHGNDIAKDEINASGGFIVGEQRYLLDNIVYYDDKYLPDETVKAANSLIFQDKVKFVVNTGGTGPTLASLPIFNDNKILELQGLCSSTLSIGTKYPYAFRTYLSPPYFYRPIVEWIRSTKYPTESQKVAIFNQNDALGWDYEKWGSALWPKAGATVVSDQYYPAGTTDFTSMLTAILAKGPTFFDPGATSPGQLGPMITQLRDLGFKGPIVAPSYQTASDLAKAVKADYLEGLIFCYPDMNNPNATKDQKSYYDTYMKNYGEPFLPLSVWSYVGTKALVQAIVQAQSLDPVVVSKTLEGLTTKGTIVGDVSWGGMEIYGINHDLVANIMLDQVQGGKPVLVATLPPKIWLAP